MDNSTIVFLINDDTRAVMGRYEANGGSTLFKTMDPTISVGDLCVVESTTRHEMTVVEITAVDVDVNFDTQSNVKWVVQKIDKAKHAELIEQETAAISAVQHAERARKKDELRKSLFAAHEGQIKALSLSKMDDTGPTE